MKKFVRHMVWYGTVGAIACAVGVLALVGYLCSVAYAPIFAPIAPATKHEILIKSGTTVSQTARLLHQSGVTGGVMPVRLIMQITGRSPQAGLYTFTAGQTVWDVVKILNDGDTSPFALTVPEGTISADVVRLLNANTYLTGLITGQVAEGTILPETYYVDYGTPRADVLHRMQAHHAEVLDTIWQNRNKKIPLKSKAELVIVASIVELETPIRAEMPRVAGVYLNRIRKKMHLNADPTVAYGVTMGKHKMKRLLTRRDLRKPTPYNTYTNYGLPPTPISNPGYHALFATANPTQTDDLYFVADGTGGHVFAKTYKQHKRNVAKWRKINK